MNPVLSIVTALFGLLTLPLLASPLEGARVSRAVNDVKIAGSPGKPGRAAERGILRAADRVHVGARSRAELVFPDGTHARLGSETVLGFRPGTRDLVLERGTLLLEVPNFCGGARIHTGSLVSVCGAGTFLVEHLPAQSLKIVALEGDLRVAVGSFLGDSLVTIPGKMVITTPDVAQIPNPVDVDLETLVRTSSLIDPRAFSPGAAALARLPQIQREIARQGASIKRTRLIPTNLSIVGSGTALVIPGQTGVDSAIPAPPIVAAGSRFEKNAPTDDDLKVPGSGTEGAGEPISLPKP